MVTRESQQFGGVGFDLRDFAMQSQAPYGTGAQQATCEGYHLLTPNS